MTAIELLALLNEQGIALSVDGADLRVSAPKGGLTEELRTQLVEHKSELLELLATAGSPTGTVDLSERAGPQPRSSVPLSFAQERLWFLEQLEPGATQYNLPAALRLHGDLDQAALEAALQTLLLRHEALRTVITTAGRAPAAKVVAAAHLPLERHDAMTAGEQELLDEITRLCNLPFDLATGPLLRAHLLQSRASEYVLLLVAHHSVADGISLAVLLQELAALYQHAGDSAAAGLTEPTAQYADYAQWQREHLQGPELTRLLDYWRERLDGAPLLLELPTDRPRPAQPSHRGAWAMELLPKELLTTLQNLAQQQETTLFMVLLAAFNVLLFRYTRQEDLLVGTPVAGRPLSNTESMVGLFVNSVVMRNQLNGALTFIELLRQVTDNGLDALSHQELPFEKLVEELQPERDIAISPVFQVLFNMQSREGEMADFAGLSTTPVIAETGTAKFDLSVLTEDRSDGLAVWFEYSTDLFEQTTIEQMLRRFGMLLQGIANAPDESILTLPLLDNNERRLILEDWNQTSRDYPQDATLVSLFEAQVERTPDAPAVTCADTTLSYAELNKRANQLANYLRESGIGSEHLVGVCLERSPELVIALYGIIKAGAAYVPLDPDYPPQRLQHMLVDARIGLLLAHSQLADRLPDNITRVINVNIGWDAIAIGNCSTTNPPPLAAPDRAAYVIFTSGSTGRPKGVLNEHRGIVNRLLWMQDEYPLDSSDIVLQKTPFSFDVSVWEFFWPLLTGAQLVLARPGGHKDARYLVELVRTANITTLHFVPSMLRSFLQAEELDTCTSLRRTFCSGEALPVDLQQEYFAHFDCALHNLYGPTEAAIDVTYWECQADDPGTAVPIGRPVANCRIYIVDEANQPVPVGVPGELLIGGVQVARGYVNRPELTAERFVADPFTDAPDARVYRTGDLARFRPDGVIEFLGRIDFQVKLRGFRIELGEIEAELQRCPGVAQAVVLVREAAAGDDRLVAYIQPAAAGSADTATLRTTLAERLPDYMLPAAFVTLDELPVTANGKLNRNALPAPDWSALLSASYTPPRNPTETVLCEIWADVLQLERIGVHDDFFRAGGHSLLAARAVARIADTLNKHVTLKQLFDHPTVSALALAISGADAEHDLVVITPRAPDRAPPLSPAQRRLWILDQMDPGNAAYNIPWATRLTGQPDVAALQAALDALLERHESLRTAFGLDAGEPTQIVLPAASARIKLRRQHVSAAELATELTRLAQHAFALDRAPLIRVTLLTTGATEHVLHVVMHHIIGDAWSTNVVQRELAQLYNAAATATEASLPPLPIQYGDYAAWQCARLDTEVAAATLDYWREQLQGAPAALDLPTDRPRPAVQTHHGAWHGHTFSGELSRAVKRFASEQNATLFMVLFAAFNTLLSRYTGQTDIVVGTPVAGRRSAALENLIGFFINTLPLRNQLDPEAPFEQLLATVKHNSLAAFEQQDLPFEQLVEQLQPVRDTSRAPVFQVLFILQNAPGDLEPLHELEQAPVLFEFGNAKLDLTLSMEERAGQLVGYFEYNTDLFDSATIERLALHFERVVAQAVAEPARPLGAIELLGEAERRQLASWNETGTDYPAQCLHELFSDRANRQPASIAVRCGTSELSYGELDKLSNRLAHRILAALPAGTNPSSPVALCLPRSVDLLVALLAILKAGRAYVPLDPDFPIERLHYMLTDCGAELLLTDSRLAAPFADSNARSICIDQPDANPQSGAGEPDLRYDPQQLAYLIYTSGSTGQPKGVAIRHSSAVNFVHSMQHTPGIAATDSLLAVTTLSFDIAVLELFAPLLAGGTVVLATRAEAADGFALARLLDAHGISVMQATPATWRMLLQTGWSGSPQLKILCGGEALDAELAGQLASRGAELWNMYGPTETTVWSTCARIDADAAAITVGGPIANTTCYVLDGERRPVPIGVTGELYIGGAGVAAGYHGKPELTAEKFIADPFNAAHTARLYNTGDLARWRADGQLQVLGRADFQVKLRGFRIELGEIETAVADIASVSQCVTVLREDTPGDQRLVAYLTTSGELPGQEALRSALRNRLPDYMVPAAFVELSEFPLTPNGKIDRRQLPAPDWTTEQEYVAPRNDLEQRLAKLWTDVLQVDQVGIYDDFFALGGHSLSGTRLVSKILAELGFELPLMTLFNSPTIAAMAELLADREAHAAGNALVPVARAGRLPLSFAQQRLWFLDELSPGDPMYNIPWVMHLSGQPDSAALQTAIDAVVARHESLRTVFPAADGEPVQKILPQMSVLLQEEDWRDADAGALQARLTELAQRRMQIATGPLMHVTLLRQAEHEYLLALVIHHIVFDAWSHGILLRELAQFYNAARGGNALELPPLAIEFADYASWEREWFGSAAFEQQLNYWKTQLADAPGTLDLPTDKPRPPVQTSNGANISRMLDPALHADIKALCEREGVSLFMTMLAAFNVLMARYSGQQDLLVGTPSSGRNRAELEDIVGFFLHTLVIRADLDGDPSFRSFLDRTRQTVLEAFAHQDVPFETLVEALEPERDTSRHPLFQVHFVLQHVDIDWTMFDELQGSPFEFEFGTAKFDIMFFVFDANEQLSVRLEYNTDLFLPDTIERMIDHFETLLAGIVADADMPVGRLPLLPADERQKLLVEWNDTALEYPGGQTMHGLFETQAAAQPDTIALRYRDTDLSYRTLNRRANKLAAELISRGVGPEVLAAICCERCPEMIVAMLAVQKAGGAYVPVDPDYPPQRVAHMLSDSEAPVLLTQSSLRDRLPENDAAVLCLDELDWSTAEGHDENPASGVTESNLGYVIYTSGSTGLPKGVEIEHRNAVALIRWAGEAFSPEEFAGVLASTSICFDLSIFEIFCPLGLGGRLILVQDALALPELDSASNVTLINTVPSAMAELVRIKGVPASVKTVNLAGEPLSTALVNAIYALGTVARVNDLYGPSEDTTYSTWTRREADAAPTIGRPVYNTQAYILDPYGEPVPTGIAGELYLSGAGVTRGYRNRPELTAQRYVTNVFGGDDPRTSRCYRTGDRVRYRADGNMEFLGRLDHQVKLRGFRIELGEIETALASHPAVENTVVMAREDREGDKRLVAYIVASTEKLEGAELATWEAEQVNQWQDLWQEAYSEADEAQREVEPGLNFSGWNSSYTGAPIPHAEMLSWLEHTAATISSVGLGDVLEIGSGTGLIVGQLAASSASYIATDFSAASVDALNELRASRAELERVEVRQCRADQLDEFPAAAFDLIILNSVAQYFPDIDYLLNFVRSAAARLRDGGHIFLGDLRSATLLQFYHTSVQLHQAEDDLAVAELNELIRQRTEQEEELLVDPALFIALQAELPELTGIRYQLKRGHHNNELTKFRYDVVLQVRGTDAALVVPEHLDWNETALNLEALRDRLSNAADSSLLLTAIPDARLVREAAATELLEHADDGTVRELRTALAKADLGITAEDLYALAAELGFDLQLTGTLPGQMSALFRPGQQPRFDGALLHAARPVPWRDYGNDPLHGRLQRSLVPILRERLLEAVPDYMVPSAFVIMDAFPLTPNGKVNRKALPAPERKRSENQVYVAPRTPVEEQLAEIWSQVLGIARVGIHDDFFALGGHSLLATQLISRIRDGLKTELPLLSLFNNPTVAGLALEISGDNAAVASAVIDRCARDTELPLSFAQQRLWFLHQLEGISSTYNVPLALELTGRVDVGALQAAVNDLVARHESLRTQFIEAYGKPAQMIVPELELNVDIVSIPSASREELQQRLETLAQTPFNLAAQQPLVRVHLLRGPAQTSILLLLMHHIVSDGWSLGILARELAALYAGYCSGAPAELPELPIQYADYAVWQRRWLSGSELGRQLDYWREQLDDAPALLQLPTDRPRPALQSFNGAHLNQTYGIELGQQLRDLAQQEDCTLFMVLLAAYNVLLSRYAGTDDLVVGTPIAGRTRTEIEGLIGFFVNTLALRVDLSGDPDFIEVLRRTKRTALAAYAHQELPFEKLVEELQPERDTSHPPVFQTLFVLQENLSDDIAFHELEVTPLDFELGSAKFDLSLFMVEFADGLTASFEYNTDLFDAPTIAAMLDQLQTLLQGIAAEPTRPVAELPLMSAAAKQQLLSQLNPAPLPTTATPVHVLVEQQAARTPAAPAVTAGADTLTYAELNARANRLARELVTAGAGAGKLIAVSTERGLPQVLSVLAVLKTGAAYVPIDPAYPAARVELMLNDSAAPVLLTDRDIATAAKVIRVDQFDWAAGASGNLDAKVGEHVYAIYTSGSTGVPKGVLLTHAGLSNLLQWQLRQPGLDRPARTLQFASLSFDVSFQELFSTWAQGGTLVLINQELRRDLGALTGFMAAQQIERAYMPFAVLQPLAEACIARPELELVLQDIVVAGEQLQVTPAVRAWFTHLGDARLHNHYGPSETHVVTAHTLAGAAHDWPALPPIGRAVDNCRAYVLDERGQPVPIGVPGELYLAGVQVASGYLNQPELTADRFTEDPFADTSMDAANARMYRTGDRARVRRDGVIEFLGRTDDQVKWRGFRIEPGEIEARLAAHPDVSQAAVLLREDTPGDKRLVAYVCAESGLQPDTRALQSWLRERLPDYMVPGTIVALDQLPLTASGKIARRKLPEPGYSDDQQHYVAPRTPTEEVLVALWAEVLHAGQIGIHDDFFERGGHSLLATQLLARVRATLQVELPLVTLFNHPTVAEFAGDVASASGVAPAAPLVRAERPPTVPLSFAQQRLWFLDQLEPGNPVYNVPWAMHLEGTVNLSALQAALDALLERHESLRTVFRANDGKPAQTVLPALSIAVQTQRCAVTDATALHEELHRLARLPFALADGPLLRVHLLSDANEHHVLLLVLHHIISDGWSLGVLYSELVQLYRGQCTAQPVALPPLPIQYADYALWQQEEFAATGLAEQLDYWRARLAGAPAVLELPTDRPRGAAQTYNGGFVEALLPDAIHRGLHDISRSENATLFMVCLAAFNVLLARYSGQRDITIGTPVAGRRQPEVENLIGFFINTLVMRNEVDLAADFRKLVRQVKRTALEGFAHQDLPFEKLVDELHPVRDMSHAPLFQVAFILQNTPWDQSARLHNLDIAPLELDYGVAKFDLSLVMAERREGLLVHLEYNTDLFDRSTAERMTAHFETLLLAIVSAADQPVGNLPLLSAPERERILYEWNDTTNGFADASCIHTLIENRSAQQPDAPAVLFGDATTSYETLNQRANRIAHLLQARGAAPGTIVGLCMPRSPDLVATLLGILKAGAAYVPLDPQYPAERLEWMLTDTAAPLIVTTSELVAELPEHQAETLCIDALNEELTAHPVSNPACSATAEDLAYVIYTSGSTGKPKGVMIPHRGVCNLADAQARVFGLGPGDRMLQFASISFDASIFELVMGLQVGAAMVLAPQDELLPGAPLLNTLQRHNVSAVTLPPTALSQLPPAELPALHTITVAGEACPPELVQQWADKRRFFNLYGPTEATVWASYAQCYPGERITIGKPVSNTRLYVVDAQLQAAPLGVPGELCIGGAGLAQGYLNRPELTAEKFLPDPFRSEAGARIYRTGDLVRLLPDGNIEFLGRIDQQVKVRGFRIELGEIEAALTDYPSVREAVVVANQEELAARQLVAYLIPAEHSELSLSELRAHLRQRLPDFMVPAAFVVLDEFPLTPNRKVDRNALPAPDENRLSIDAAYVAPQSGAEKTLADIWQELLGVERVGVHDNFFELGGDSILSIQIIARASRAGLQLTPKQLFEHQTIAELAAAAAGSERIAAAQTRLTGPALLTPIQHWFAGQHRKNPQHFNQSQLLDSAEPLQLELAEQALQAVVRHHDALRMTVNTGVPGWEQTIQPDAGDNLVRLINLRGLKLEAVEHHRVGLANALQASFDLESGPLIKALLIKRGHDLPDQLLICAHHMVVDWVSWNIILEDLQLAYTALRDQQPVRLPLKTTAYRDWAARLRQLANADPLQAERDWWLSQDWAAAGQLQPDHATGPADERSTRDVTLWLDSDETRILQQELPRRWRTQINDVLLTAVGSALQEWTAATAAAIHLEGHGREDLFADVDVSRTVGWFTSLYPLLLQVPTDAPAGAALNAVKAQLRAVPDKGIGFGMLRYLASAADVRDAMRALPVPEVGFNYLGQIDQVAGSTSLLTPSFAPRGAELCPTAERMHLVDIAIAVVEGRLQISVLYSSARFGKATISRFAEGIVAALRRLLEATAAQPAELTPADFPLAALEQTTLDQLVAEAGEVEDIYSVTPLQHGMLFHSLLSGDHDVYFARFRWRLEGPLDAPLFAAAWDQVIERNSSLRTSFRWEGLAEPLQVVARSGHIELQREDWSELGPAEQDHKLRAFLDSDQRRRFDFTQAPLMRLMLIKLGATDHQFIWSFHHAIIDGWSVPLVLKEVFALYDAARTGRTAALPEPQRFSSYVAWLQRQDGAAAEYFWRDVLAGFRAPTPLPSARVQQVSLTSEPDYQELQLQVEATTVNQLRNLAQQSRLTLNTLVQGIWGLLLSRYSGESDVVFGATTSGRPAAMPGVAQMIGLFLNTLPVRLQIDDSAPLLDWLQSLQTRQLEVRQYEFASLVEVQGWSDVPRGTPLFGSLLAFENYPDMETMWTDTDSVTIREVDGFDRTNFPLTLNVAVFDILHLRMVYDGRMFAAAAMTRLAEHFASLLRAVADNPRVALGELSMLSAAEERQLQRWNETAAEYPQEAMFAAMTRHAAATPDALAVECGEQRLTYGELERRANQLAHHLLNLGAQADAPVGLCMERAADMLVALIAIQKSGAAYLPLDPGFPADRLRYMLEDSGARLLITDDSVAELSAGLQLTEIRLAELDRLTTSLPESAPDVRIRPDQLAYMIYTSGSTGKPKGVAIEHRAAVNFLTSMVRTPGIYPADRLLAVTTLSFDISVLELFAPLTAGATVVIATRAVLTDGFALARLLDTARITVMQATPATWRLLLQGGWERDQQLRVLCGGEALDLELAQQLALPGHPVWNMYGPTETTIWSTCEAIEHDAELVSVGRPIANTRVYVLDAQLRPVPVGVAGELFIGGTGVARGYHERDELNAERFLADPFAGDNTRMYRTGDLARFLPDGRLLVLGRTDFQVKLRGFRIELGEIEAVLAGRDDVTQCVVALREDTPGDQRLVAYYTSTATEPLDADELTALLQHSLPDYMVPSAFMRLDEFPLTPNGKVDRLSLPAPEWTSTREYAAPRNDTETQLAAIWEEILNVEQVGIHDDFFALGGHSLIAMKLVSRIMEKMSVTVGLEKLFDAPTIAGLAAAVAQSVNQADDTAAPMGEIAPIKRAARRKRRVRKPDDE